jgi:hypothetical protein
MMGNGGWPRQEEGVQVGTVLVTETVLLSEAALAEDWNRPEEKKAWAHLAGRVVLVAFPFSNVGGKAKQ